MLGKLLLLLAALMAPSLLVSLYYAEGDTLPFVYAMLLALAAGLPMALLSKPASVDMNAREGFASVGLAWLMLSMFGALPFWFSGAMPYYWDALFECVSGLTTTGASILPQVENLPHGILFWRSFTHWVGGMGVLVLTMAVMPKVSGRNSFLARAESPGPSYSKLLPRMADTSRILYIIYFVMTLVLIALLLLTGMPLFDTLIHAMGTAGTGGFSSRNLSVGAYNNPWAEMIIMVFMFLFGTNFLIYFRLLRGEGLKALKNDELKAYYLLALGAIVLIALQILPKYGNVFSALRYASFQVGSIMSTTGYATADFDLWPAFSRILLLMLMLIGASAGSTAGGIKVVRMVLLGKMTWREVLHTINPRSVKVVKLDGKSVPEDTLGQVGIFAFVYFSFLMLGTLLASLDGHDFLSCFSAAASCLSNIGPGLSLVGPVGNFSVFSPAVKLFLTLLMLLGRLEFFPILVLFHPAIWRSGRR